MQTVRLYALPFLLLPLAGCVSDSASYLIGGDNQHTVTLIRNQDFLWKDSANVDIVPTRLPECQGSLKVRDVPRSAGLTLYWSPYDYAEPIYILEVEGDSYAVSTASCRVQKFEKTPDTLGDKIGQFIEEDGQLTFRPEAPSRGG